MGLPNHRQNDHEPEKVEQDVKGEARRRWLALLLVCAAQHTIVLD